MVLCPACLHLHLFGLILRSLLSGPCYPSEYIALQRIVDGVVFLSLCIFQPRICFIFMLLDLYHFACFLVEFRVLSYLFSIEVEKAVVWCLLDIWIGDDVYIVAELVHELLSVA